MTTDGYIKGDHIKPRERESRRTEKRDANVKRETVLQFFKCIHHSDHTFKFSLLNASCHRWMDGLLLVVAFSYKVRQYDLHFELGLYGTIKGIVTR